MSWGALPMWVWDAEYEYFLAQCSCSFDDEWYAGTSRVFPKHVIDMSRATFKSWEKGGWNETVDSKCISS